MGCGCNKAQAKRVYVYVAKDGTQTIYTSQVQAQAAVIRNGGGTWREEAA